MGGLLSFSEAFKNIFTMFSAIFLILIRILKIDLNVITYLP